MQNNTPRFPPTTLSELRRRPNPETVNSIFDQFQLQPSPSALNMRGNIIHIAPEVSEVGQPQVAPSNDANFRMATPVTLNTVPSNYTNQSISLTVPSVRPTSRESFPQQLPVQGGGNRTVMPLQQIDPTMAKNIIGQLMQVLQNAGQQDDTMQRLMQLSPAPCQPSAGPSPGENCPQPLPALGIDDAVAAVPEESLQSFEQPEQNQTAPSHGDSTKDSSGEVDHQMAQNVTEPLLEQSSGSHSDGASEMPPAEVLPPVEVKSEVIDTDFNDSSSEIYAKYNLRRCSVALERTVVRRDSRGKIALPKSVVDGRSRVTDMLKVSFSKQPTKQKTVRNAGSAIVDAESKDFPDSMKIQLLRNMNEALDHSVRTMYMGPNETIMQWLTVVWRRKNDRFFCQCVFCPLMAESPKSIVKHIREDHPELTFALNKKELLGKSFLFINCRHCDFVTIDPVVLWIHMELHHGISGVLDGGLHPDVDLDMKFDLAEISSHEVIVVVTSYVCFDCFKVSTDSKALAFHVLQDHADTLNYNGCFVKLMMIQKPTGNHDMTYNQAISDPDLAGSRCDVFICMLCNLSVRCAYAVVSHTLSCHQNRGLLHVCSECPYNTVSDDRMIEHLNREHDKASRLACSATVVNRLGSKVVEVPVSHNRKAALNSTKAKNGAGQKNGDEGNYDEEDDDYGGSMKKKPKLARKTPVKKPTPRTNKTSKSGATAKRRPSKEPTVQSKSVSSSHILRYDDSGKPSGKTVRSDNSLAANTAPKVKAESDDRDEKILRTYKNFDDGSEDYVVNGVDYTITLANEVDFESDQENNND